MPLSAQQRMKFDRFETLYLSWDEENDGANIQGSQIEALLDPQTCRYIPISWSTTIGEEPVAQSYPNADFTSDTLPDWAEVALMLSNPMVSGRNFISVKAGILRNPHADLPIGMLFATTGDWPKTLDVKMIVAVYTPLTSLDERY